MLAAHNVHTLDDPSVHCCVMGCVAREYNQESRSQHISDLYVRARTRLEAKISPPLSLTIGLVSHKPSGWLARPLDEGPHR